MKNDEFKIYFNSGFSCIVYARQIKAAKILAQAIQIKAGRDYRITEWKKLS